MNMKGHLITVLAALSIPGAACGTPAETRSSLGMRVLETTATPPALQSWLEAESDKGGTDIEVLDVFFGTTTDPDTTDVVYSPLLGVQYFPYIVYRVTADSSVTQRVRLFIDGDLFDEGDVTNNPNTTVVVWSSQPWVAVPGDHVYLGEVDAFDQIAETNENNNTLSLDFSVGGGSICRTDKTAPWKKGVFGPIPPDEFEDDDTQDRASVILVGEVQSQPAKGVVPEFPQLHNFHDGGDLDWIKFHVVLDDDANMPVHQVTARNPDFRADVVMEMFDPAGNPVTNFGDSGVVNDTGPGQEEQVDWTPDDSGTYYLCSHQEDPGVSGEGTEYESVISLFAAADAGQIIGVVRDAQSGGPINQALLETEPGSSYRWSTDDGSYALINLTEAAYDVKATAVGYEARGFNSVAVSAGQATPLDVFLTPSEKTGFAVTEGISGSWFDSSHAGEGWLLEVLTLPTASREDGKGQPGIAVAYWFTYPSADSLDRRKEKGAVPNQAWFVGAGEITGDTIHFRNVLNPSGGRFGPTFDPTQVQQSIWGEYIFHFDSCDTGTMTYVGPPDWGTGTMDLERITQLHDLDCTTRGTREAGDVKVTEIGAGMSGSWFDPDHDGEGWLIEVLSEDLALVYWFSYDTAGNPAWWVGVGTIDDKTITIEDARLFFGALFGPTFDPAQVASLVWGRMVFTFSSCNTGSMTYESLVPEFASGTLNLQRITSVAGLSCAD